MSDHVYLACCTGMKLKYFRVLTNIFCTTLSRNTSSNKNYIYLCKSRQVAHFSTSTIKYSLKTMPDGSDAVCGTVSGTGSGSYKITEGIRLKWNLTAGEIEKKTEQLISDTNHVYDAVGALNKEDVTFANTLQVLAEHEAVYASTRSEVDFMQHVSESQELRDASVAADKKISDFEVEISMRQDVFDNLCALKADAATWKPEAIRFHERLIKMGKRNGLHLESSLQAEIKQINKKMSELSIDFSKNLNEDDTQLEFSQSQLDGLPEDLLKTLDRTETGLYKVSLKYPHYFPAMKFVHSSETRHALEKAFHSMCVKENTIILEELVQLRQKKASLLGFGTHAAFILDMRMAKNPDNVAKFLSDLKDKLQPLKKNEIALFLQYKKENCEKLGCNYDGKINMWDLRYYMTRTEERKYAVNQNLLKQYFPLNVVTKGLLDIYQELLGLVFTEVTGCEVWHKDVTMYSVTDNGRLLGYFYLDLFPRTGKYGHAACFVLQPGCIQTGSTRQVAVAAMVANFTKPTADAPSLLTHDEVETYFHEFGHVMHHICARADYALFSGTSVERDFVEAPSQMLENWVWQKESLSRLSSHYKTNEPIPDDLLQSLIASRAANAGVFNLRQILLATFDQAIHSQEKVDTAALYSELCADILGIPATAETNMAASFRHIAGGYDAQYYGYLWSEVFSADMFYTYFKDSPMNTEASMKYRRCILEPGGTIDAEVMLQNFLGRAPRQDAFLHSKGLSDA